MRKVIVVATVLAVLAITAAAQAEPGSSVSQDSDVSVSVPALVETLATLPSCPAADTSPTVSPTPPATVNVVTQDLSAKVTVGLAGVWTTTGSTNYTVTCSSTVTHAATVTVTAIPPEDSAVGVGADTGGLMDQLGGDYNATLTSLPHHGVYNWDSTNPTTGAIGDFITSKSNCPSFHRPDGSSQGIAQLSEFEATADGEYYCVNFASSSRTRSPLDPPYSSGGIAFVALAGDAVTWAAQATTDAPKTLTPAQLNAIYACTDTNWDQVGGKNATITPFLPQGGSGTTAFFLAAIGVSTAGACVNNENDTLQDGDGAYPALDSPEAIYPYSIGQYIAQRYRSAACVNSSCTPNSKGVTCVAPSATQNFFGCDSHGTMDLKQINGVDPTTGSGGSTVINTSFPTAFDRTLYDVVPYDSNTADHIPGSESGAPGGVDLESIFGATGWACISSTAKDDIQDYGFVLIPTCGSTS